MINLRKNADIKNFVFPHHIDGIIGGEVKLRDGIVIDDIIHGTLIDDYRTGTIRIYKKDPFEFYGHIEYILEKDGTFIISMIHVREDMRRKGYATQMLKYAKSTYSPHKELEWGPVFPLGKLLRDSKKYERFRKKRPSTKIKRCRCK